MRAGVARVRGAGAAKKGRVKGALATPEFARKLMKHIGPTAAAKAIGTTPGTLHKARNANTISQPLEVAARAIWRELGYAESEAAQAPTSEGLALMVVQVPRGREEIIKKTTEAIGGVVLAAATM